MTLWYAGTLMVILSLFGGVLYTSVRSNLLQNVDQVLISVADGVADAISSFGKAEVSAQNPNVSSQDKITEIFLRKLLSRELPSLVGRWAGVTNELETVRPVRIRSRFAHNRAGIHCTHHGRCVHGAPRTADERPGRRPVLHHEMLGNYGIRRPQKLGASILADPSEFHATVAEQCHRGPAWTHEFLTEADADVRLWPEHRRVRASGG